jgi:hypothetical protein
MNKQDKDNQTSKEQATKMSDKQTLPSRLLHNNQMMPYDKI